jgi:hypothetical protein
VRIKLLVVVVVAIIAGDASPAVAQSYPNLGFVGDLVDKVLQNSYFEGPDKCGWYWDDWHGWQYWCWSPYYGWYIADGCMNQTQQQNNNPTGGANYSYQSCNSSG